MLFFFAAKFTAKKEKSHLHSDGTTVTGRSGFVFFTSSQVWKNSIHPNTCLKAVNAAGASQNT